MRDRQKPLLLKTGMSDSRDHATAVTLVLPLVAASGDTEKLLVGVFYDRRFDPVDQIDFIDVSQPSI